MSSLRRHEGYLLVDHSASPGLTPEQERAMGMPEGAGRGVFEAPIYTCSHCEAGVVVNPLRTRDRSYCPKCDHIICDRCEAIRVASGGECKTFKQVIEEVQEKAAREEQRGGVSNNGGSVIILSTK